MGGPCCASREVYTLWVVHAAPWRRLYSMGGPCCASREGYTLWVVHAVPVEKVILYVWVVHAAL